MGLEGLGPIDFEKRVFVEPWEKRIFGIHVAMMALSSQLPLPATPSPFKTVWTWADLRKGAESLNPFDYFKYRYYEKWLGGISGYFVENGYITQAELDARTQQFLNASPPAPQPAAMPRSISASTPISSKATRPSASGAMTPKFAKGDKVYVKNVPTIEHTRLPGYLRDQIGVVDTVYPGLYVYLTSTGPDGIGDAMPVYCVRFDPEEIWKGNTDKKVGDLRGSLRSLSREAVN